MTTTAATPAQRRLAARMAISPEELERRLPSIKAAILSWAGRNGRFTFEDVLAIINAHGETLGAWVDECNEAARFQSVCDVEALLTWLG
jgi:hypothetical protein